MSGDGQTPVRISREELLREIAETAYVVADVAEGKAGDHPLHQTCDICEGENRELTERRLELAFAVARERVRPLLAASERSVGRVSDRRTGKGDFRLRLRGHDRHGARAVCETVRSYMLASALAWWLGITLPASADEWRRREEELLERLTTTTATLQKAASPKGRSGGFGRRAAPIA